MARTANIFVSVVYFEREKKTKREKKGGPGRPGGPGPGRPRPGPGPGPGGATVVSKNLNQTDWRTDRKAFTGKFRRRPGPGRGSLASTRNSCQ